MASNQNEGIYSTEQTETKNDLNLEKGNPKTKTALNLLKGGFTEFKLMTKQLTGLIQESENDAKITEASQKLDLYHEQLLHLLTTATQFSVSLIASSNNEKKFIQQLKKSGEEIERFNIKKPTSENKNFLKFTQVSIEIVDNIEPKQNQLEERGSLTNTLIVEPLRGILQNEIVHCTNTRKKYLKQKRLYDDISTTVAKLRGAIKHLEDLSKSASGHNNSENVEHNIPTNNTSNNLNHNSDKGKFNLSKLFKPQDRENLKLKLIQAERDLENAQILFEQSKVSFLEAISIVEHKMNEEVVYYMNQFNDYCKSGVSNQKNIHKPSDSNILNNASELDEVR